MWEGKTEFQKSPQTEEETNKEKFRYSPEKKWKTLLLAALEQRHDLIPALVGGRLSGVTHRREFMRRGRNASPENGKRSVGMTRYFHYGPDESSRQSESGYSSTRRQQTGTMGWKTISRPESARFGLTSNRIVKNLSRPEPKAAREQLF